MPQPAPPCPNRFVARLPPAITIHGTVHLALALAPRRPVTLLSAPGAALFAGATWWRTLIATPNFDAPITHAHADILDCADAAGRALEALACACRIVLLHPCPAWPSIAERAAAQGATLLAHRPLSLDLARPGAQHHIAAWLDPQPPRLQAETPT